jgi:hypothetical protein
MNKKHYYHLKSLFEFIESRAGNQKEAKSITSELKDEDIFYLMHIYATEKPKLYDEALDLVITHREGILIKLIYTRVLSFIIYQRNTEAMKLLIEKISYINAIDENGDTALHYAINEKNIEAMKLLIEKGANTEILNSYHETPLYYATKTCNIEAIKLLITNGANINSYKKELFKLITVMDIAHLLGNQESIKTIKTVIIAWKKTIGESLSNEDINFYESSSYDHELVKTFLYNLPSTIANKNKYNIALNPYERALLNLPSSFFAIEDNRAISKNVGQDEIQKSLFKAAIGFKYFDTGINTLRMLYSPTIDNVKKFATDATYLYSMYVGINGAAIIINGIEVAAKLYHGENEQAITQSLTTLAYIAAPSAIAFTGIPYAGLAYGAGLTVLGGYSAITNSYSLYQEYYEEN